VPIPSPVFEKIAPLCTSMRWKQWAGYYAVCSFDTLPDREYFAFRHGAGLIDVSPLFKYEVHGADAARFLARIMTKDITKLKIGQVTYCCWCDEDGKLIDDGTVTCLAENYYRVTAAEPSYAWFERYRRGFAVTIEDSSTRFAALSLQGPNSRDILREVCDFDVAALKFFRATEGKVAGAAATVSRTGYTGDLGYEIWTAPADAAKVFSTLLDKGDAWGIKPCGLDAMDITRIEAGFIMNGVEYFSANHCLIEARKSSPYELNLGWCINLDREPFVGQAALQREAKTGPKRKMVGLEIDWMELENLYSARDLPPQICQSAWRDGRPVYNSTGEFIGQATSGTWSPTLKKNLALATVASGYATPGNKLRIEVTVEYERKTVTATVTDLPFYNPARKKA